MIEIEKPIVLDETFKEKLDTTNGILIDLVKAIGGNVDNVKYGFRRTKGESDPQSRISYLHDAVGMTPAYMDFTNNTFNYGSWRPLIEKISRPVMLKTSGVVDYELSRDNYAYRKDGTSSDVSSTSYDGNAMIEFSYLKYVKRYEDTDYEYVIFSNKQLDSDYHAYAFTNSDNIVRDTFYYGIYEGYNNSSKYRSISGVNATVSTTAEQEITYATANGSGYNIITNSQWNYICDLLTLISKSDNSQAAFGAGRSLSTNTAKISNGTMDDKGFFWGDNGGVNGVKVFGIENFWGNIWQRLAGLILDSTYKIKLTPPYCNTPVSAADYSSYIDTNITPPASGYISNINSQYGYLPISITNGDANKYFCDYFWSNTAQVDFAFVGGNWSNGARAGSRYLALSNLASYSSAGFGSRLSMIPEAS